MQKTTVCRLSRNIIPSNWKIKKQLKFRQREKCLSVIENNSTVLPVQKYTA